MEKQKGIDEMDEEVKKFSLYNFDEEEPEFKSISQNLDESQLLVWRIEKLHLKKYNEADIGRFYEGDSFLVTKINSQVEINIHVWVGQSSTIDEITYASYKAMQLDNLLQNICSIFYEVHGKESEVFLSYFKCFQILQGGIDDDLSSFKSKNYQIRLFHFHSKGANARSRQIPIKKSNIDSSDAYLLDIGLKLYLWRGKTANSFEKFNLTCTAQKIKEYRNQKIQIIFIDEGSTNQEDVKVQKEFEELIKKYEESYPDPKDDSQEKDNKDNSTFKKMMKLSDESGKLEFTEVKYDKNSLDSNDLFIIDRGDTIVIWMGKNSSKKEKRFSRFYANKYISQEGRSANLPIIVINEGKFPEELEKCFK